jgi:hypothetical protein
MARGIFALTVLAAIPTSAFAVVSPFVPSGGTSSADAIVYKEQPAGSLTVDNSLNNAGGLLTILAGNAGAPGGNVELFSSSEVPGYTLPAFQSAGIVSLSGTSGGHNVTLRSLNGLDWFGAAPNYSYGASNLANQWYNDFLSTYNFDTFLSNHGYNAGQILAARGTLYTQLIASNGIQRISDPNIGYANWDSAPDQLQVGLEGSDNYISALLPGILTGIGHPEWIADLPSPIQASEVVAVSIDGGPTQYLYGFAANPSGLTTQDGTASYTVNFEVTAAVPEPASISLLAIGALALLRRKR